MKPDDYIEYRVHIFSGPPYFMQADWENPQTAVQDMLEDTFNWDIESQHLTGQTEPPQYLGELYGWSDFSVTSEINKIESNATIEINPNQARIVRSQKHYLLGDGRGKYLAADTGGTRILLESTTYFTETNWADQMVDEGFFVQIEAYNTRLSGGQRQIIFHGVITDWKMKGDTENVELNIMSLGTLASNELAVDMFFPDFYPTINVSQLDKEQLPVPVGISKYDLYRFTGSDLNEAPRATRIIHWLIFNNRYLQIDLEKIYQDRENNVTYNFQDLPPELNALFFNFDLNKQTVGNLLDDIAKILPPNYYFRVEYNPQSVVNVLPGKTYYPVFILRRNDEADYTWQVYEDAKNPQYAKKALIPEYYVKSGDEVVNYDLNYAGEQKAHRWIVAGPQHGTFVVTNLPAPPAVATKEMTHPIRVQQVVEEENYEFDIPPRQVLTKEEQDDIDERVQELLDNDMATNRARALQLVEQQQVLNFLRPDKRMKMQGLIDQEASLTTEQKSEEAYITNIWKAFDLNEDVRLADDAQSGIAKEYGDYTRALQDISAQTEDKPWWQRAGEFLVDTISGATARDVVSWAFGTSSDELYARGRINASRRARIINFITRKQGMAETIPDRITDAVMKEAIQRAKDDGISLRDALTAVLRENTLEALPTRKGQGVRVKEESKYANRVVAGIPNINIFYEYANLKQINTQAFKNTNPTQHAANERSMLVLRNQLRNYMYPASLNKNRIGRAQGYRVSKMEVNSEASAVVGKDADTANVRLARLLGEIAIKKYRQNVDAQYTGRVVVRNSSSRAVIEYKVGQVIGFRGFNNVIDNVVARIAAVKLNKYTAELTLSYVKPSYGRRLKSIESDLANSERLN